MESSTQEIAREEGPTYVPTVKVVSFFDQIDKKDNVPEVTPVSELSSPASEKSHPRVMVNPEDISQRLQLLAVEECNPGIAGSTLNREVVLAKLNRERILSYIKAWEENMKKKCHNSYNKKIAKIDAWEVAKKATAEANLRTIEEKLENEKAACVEKAKNKIASVRKIAEEQRAQAEAVHGKQVSKAEEIAVKCRASGTRPRKFSCF